jgi:hypothetical protein
LAKKIASILHLEPEPVTCGRFADGAPKKRKKKPSFARAKTKRLNLFFVSFQVKSTFKSKTMCVAPTCF